MGKEDLQPDKQPRPLDPEAVRRTTRELVQYMDQISDAISLTGLSEAYVGRSIHPNSFDLAPDEPLKCDWSIYEVYDPYRPLITLTKRIASDTDENNVYLKLNEDTDPWQDEIGVNYRHSLSLHPDPTDQTRRASYYFYEEDKVVKQTHEDRAEGDSTPDDFGILGPSFNREAVITPFDFEVVGGIISGIKRDLGISPNEPHSFPNSEPFLG